MLRSKQKGLEIDNYIALFIQPDLSSSPEAPIGQPFTAGCQVSSNSLARFNGLIQQALACMVQG